MSAATLTLAQLREAMPLYRESIRRANARGQLIWLYAIQAGENGPIKLGVTQRPRNRIATLQQANAAELRGLAAWRTLPAEEKELHERFAYARIRGEWFRPVHELVEYVLREGRTFEDWA